MVYVFIGPSGCGKDTQAKLLERNYGIRRVSVGEIIRKEMEKGSKLGKKIKEISTRGKWIPDDIAIDLLKKELKKDKYRDGFVITGFPRTIWQVEKFDELLCERGEEITGVVHFNLDVEESMKRMQTQSVDEKRPDSSENAMKARLASYDKTINPILAEYEKKGVLIHIDAAPSIEDIHEDVKKKLKLDNN